MPLSEFFPEMEGWVPAQNPNATAPPPNANVPGPSQVSTSTDQSSAYLRAPLPITMQYAPDTLKQSNRPGLSSFRISPLPPGGQPAVNSASSSTTTSVVEEFTISGGQISFSQISGIASLAQLPSLAASNLTNGTTGTGEIVLNTVPTFLSGILGTGGIINNFYIANQSSSAAQLQFIAGIGGTAVQMILGGTLGGAGFYTSQGIYLDTPTGYGLGSGTVNVSSGYYVNGAQIGTIATGTAAMGTTLIGATSSASVVTVAATGVLSTDSISWSFNAAPPAAYQSGLFIQTYTTVGHVNFIVTNPTAGGLTPGAATLNWRVVR